MGRGPWRSRGRYSPAGPPIDHAIILQILYDSSDIEDPNALGVLRGGLWNDSPGLRALSLPSQVQPALPERTRRLSGSVFVSICGHWPLKVPRMRCDFRTFLPIGSMQYLISS